MKTEDMEKLALAYTEKEYYKADDKDELNGEPLAVFKAYCQALSVFQALQDNSDNKYTENDMRMAYNKGCNTTMAEYEKVVPEHIKPMSFEKFIQSLNKKD